MGKDSRGISGENPPVNRYVTSTGFEVQTYADPQTGKWPHRVKVTHAATGAVMSEGYTGRETTGEMRDRMMQELSEKLKLPKTSGRWGPIQSNGQPKEG